jgi:nitrite reductase/ring-hydroxylating ferredoxin subunit
MTELAAPALRTVGPADAIPNDFVVPYYLEDVKLRISVARVNDRLYAFDDLCTCAEPPCPLSGGLLTGTTLMCQCHGSRFDVATGAVLNGPAASPLNGYEVKEIGGNIQIRA